MAHEILVLISPLLPGPGNGIATGLFVLTKGFVVNALFMSLENESVVVSTIAMSQPLEGDNFST